MFLPNINNVYFPHFKRDIHLGGGGGGRADDNVSDC